MPNLTFEEFNAISNRERNRKKTISSAAIGGDGVKSSFESDDEGSSGSSSSSVSMFNGLGELMESQQMQSLSIFLIVMDFVASYMDLILRLVQLNDATIKYFYFAPSIEHVTFIRNLLASFGSFTLFFFSFELILMLFAFGFSYLKHLGYLLDFLIIAGEIYCDLIGVGREVRLINILRLWRIARLASFFVMIESYQHFETKKELDEVKSSVTKLESEKENINAELKKEQETRTSVETMLQNYREEVDTLNEALKIAAKDIADIGEDEDDEDDDDDEDDGIDGIDDNLYGDDDDDDVFNDGREVFQEALSSELTNLDSIRNKEILREKVQRDKSDAISMRSGRTNRSSLSNMSGKSKNSVTFKINADGTVSKM